jgi:hypothetical protein
MPLEQAEEAGLEAAKSLNASTLADLRSESARQPDKHRRSWGCWQLAGNFAVFDMPAQEWDEPIRDAQIPD